jgi:hypothetical protein
MPRFLSYNALAWGDLPEEDQKHKEDFHNLILVMMRPPVSILQAFDRSEEFTLKMIAHELAQCVGAKEEEVLSDIELSALSHWAQDPLFLGSYTYKSGEDFCGRYQKKGNSHIVLPGGRVALIGEGCADVENGFQTAEGAYNSAREAVAHLAAQVVASRKERLSEYMVAQSRRHTADPSNVQGVPSTRFQKRARCASPGAPGMGT